MGTVGATSYFWKLATFVQYSEQEVEDGDDEPTAYSHRTARLSGVQQQIRAQAAGVSPAMAEPDILLRPLQRDRPANARRETLRRHFRPVMIGSWTRFAGPRVLLAV